MDDSDSPTPGTLTRAVAVRVRHDGWTPDKQHDFIAALAETGCVTEAAAAVGMSPKSAYRLRARPDASAFRQSWDIALDYAIRNLSDAAYSRALHGVATPIFYKGEQVGERRRFDERLTMFLLRYRDPVRYGAWLDSMEARRHPDGAAVVLANALNVVFDRAHGVFPDPPAVDPDSGDPADPFEMVEPPLADGPSPPATDTSLAGLEGEEWTAEVLRVIRRHSDQYQRSADDDGTAEHWQGAAVTRTPRVRRR
jgi:hypothetical protein